MSHARQTFANFNALGKRGVERVASHVWARHWLDQRGHSSDSALTASEATNLIRQVLVVSGIEAYWQQQGKLLLQTIILQRDRFSLLQFTSLLGEFNQLALASITAGEGPSPISPDVTEANEIQKGEQADVLELEKHAAPFTEEGELVASAGWQAGKYGLGAGWQAGRGFFSSDASQEEPKDILNSAGWQAGKYGGGAGWQAGGGRNIPSSHREPPPSILTN